MASTNDWSEAEVVRARSEGWRLATTVDNGSTRPYLMIAAAAGKILNDRDAQRLVIEQAKAGSVFHQSALKIMALSRLKK